MEATFQVLAHERILPDKGLAPEAPVFFFKLRIGGSKERSTVKGNDTSSV